MAYSQTLYIKDLNHNVFDRTFYKNNANPFSSLFSNMGKCDHSETSCNKVELLFKIPLYSDIIMNIQGILQGYLDTLGSICKPGIFRSLAYSLLFHIEILDMFRTEVHWEKWHIPNPCIFKTMAYSKLWHFPNSCIFRTISLWKIYRISFQWIKDISIASLRRIWRQSVRKKIRQK